MTYSDDSRGSIQFPERRKQLVDFQKLRIGNITPTDCDGLIEYQNKAYILFEIKYRNATVPQGQLLALTRAVDDFSTAHKPALLIIAEHDVDDPSQNIDASQCIVRQCYFDGVWKAPSKPRTLKDLINSFIAYINK